MTKGNQIRCILIVLALVVALAPIALALWTEVSSQPGISMWTSGDNQDALVCAVGLDKTTIILDIDGKSIGVTTPLEINKIPSECYLNKDSYYLDFDKQLVALYTLEEPPTRCGDGTCDSIENCTTCKEDCGVCPILDEPTIVVKTGAQGWVEIDAKSAEYKLVVQKDEICVYNPSAKSSLAPIDVYTSKESLSATSVLAEPLLGGFGWCYTPTPLMDYVRFGDYSTVEKQTLASVVYNRSGSLIDATLYEWNGKEFVQYSKGLLVNTTDTSRLKYGAVDYSNEKLSQYKYVLSSTLLTYEKEGWYYYYEDINDVSTFTHTDFRDICNKEYEPYDVIETYLNMTCVNVINVTTNRTSRQCNTTEIPTGNTFSVYNKSANCSISMYSEGDLNYISIEFTSDKNIDPTFEFGSGTSVDPWRIWNWTDLAKIDDDSAGMLGYYTLMVNLSGDDTDYPGLGDNWTPIGNDTNPFTGSLDGKTYKISNLFINRSSEYYVGLFGYIGSGSNITNIGLEDVNVSGFQFVGGLVGYNNNGSITSSYSTGDVLGVYTVGGLVGANDGAINDSYSTGNVSGSISVGGLAGVNNALITYSYSAGDVSGGYSIGGLAGSTSGSIISSYSTGDVLGIGNVGGLVGYSDGLPGYSGGPITSSYSTSDVSGSNNVGGLVGYSNGAINDSYSTGNVSGSNEVGGLVGYNINYISNSNSTGNVSGSNEVGGLVGSSVLGSIISSYSTGDVLGISNVGGLVGYSDGLPGYSGGPITSSYSTSDVVGTANVGGLVGFSNSPINSSYSTGNVSGSNYVGGLVGYTINYVSNSNFTGNIVGNDNVGGLIGFNSGGIINNSFVFIDKSATFFSNLTVALITNDDGTGTVTNTYGTINSTYGSITFLNWNVTGTGNLTGNISINENYAFVNSTAQPGFSKSANITFLNLPQDFINPVIFKDNIVCTDCYNFTSLNAGNVTFNITSWSNYTIGEGSSNTAPITNNVIPGSGGSYNPTPCSTTAVNVQMNVTDDDGWGDIDLASASTNCTLTKGTVVVNLSPSSCTKISNSSETKALFQCTGNMQYYYESGTWDVNCTVVDTGTLTGYNDTVDLTYNRLESISVTPASISWTGITVISTDVGADDDPIVIENCGNAAFTSTNLTAYDLAGVTIPAQEIAASDFSAGDTDASDQETLVDSIPVTIAGVSLPFGDSSTTNVYTYFEQMTTPVSAQTYSASSPWEVVVYGASNTNP